MDEEKAKILQAMELPVGDGFSWMPAAASTTTPAVDEPFYLIYWVCVVAFFLVVGPMCTFMWVYRRKTPSQKALSQVDHSQFLEVLWSAIPTVFFVIIFLAGFRGYLDLYVPPKDAMTVEVTGQKWQWTMKYPCGATITGAGAEFPMPKDQAVKVQLTAVDVLHSFFVPNFRVKMDAVPWRYTTLWFEATKTGVFPVFCTEYCGQDHSNMLATIKVMEREEWDKWYEGACEAAGGPATVEAGKAVYDSVCLACHSLDGSKKVGPTFKDLACSDRPTNAGTVKADDAYLLESILEPNKKIVDGFPPAMPPMGGTLSKTKIDSTLLFLKSQSSVCK
jgi:cytochrome c oxidase subunit 2